MSNLGNFSAVGAQGARAVEQEHNHMQLSLLRVPAPTLIAHSSALKPLQRLGIELPGPQSPGDHFCLEGARVTRHAARL